MNILDRGIAWTLALVERLPTTQLVTAVGITAFVGTILQWWLLALLHSFVPTIGAWEPSGSMIGFISAWGVIAAGQFGLKRATDIDLARVKKNGDETKK
jgi:hypothetical protein